MGSEKSWGTEIFTDQFYVVTTNHCNVGCTPYVVGETKMMLDGEEFFLGLPADRCPGSSISQTSCSSPRPPSRTWTVSCSSTAASAGCSIQAGSSRCQQAASS